MDSSCPVTTQPSTIATPMWLSWRCQSSCWLINWFSYKPQSTDLLQINDYYWPHTSWLMPSTFISNRNPILHGILLVDEFGKEISGARYEIFCSQKSIQVAIRQSFCWTYCSSCARQILTYNHSASEYSAVPTSTRPSVAQPILFRAREVTGGFVGPLISSVVL